MLALFGKNIFKKPSFQRSATVHYYRRTSLWGSVLLFLPLILYALADMFDSKSGDAPQLIARKQVKKDQTYNQNFSHSIILPKSTPTKPDQQETPSTGAAEISSGTEEGTIGLLHPLVQVVGD